MDSAASFILVVVIKRECEQTLGKIRVRTDIGQ